MLSESRIRDAALQLRITQLIGNGKLPQWMPARIGAGHDDKNVCVACDRQIARDLALGETTGEVARKFRLSAGRISQLRRWLCEHWEQFQGEVRLNACAA